MSSQQKHVTISGAKGPLRPAAAKHWREPAHAGAFVPGQPCHACLHNISCGRAATVASLLMAASPTQICAAAYHSIHQAWKLHRGIDHGSAGHSLTCTALLQRLSLEPGVLSSLHCRTGPATMPACNSLLGTHLSLCLCSRDLRKYHWSSCTIAVLAVGSILISTGLQGAAAALTHPCRGRPGQAALLAASPCELVLPTALILHVGSAAGQLS